MTLEEYARQQIDTIRRHFGWTVQNKSQTNLHAAEGNPFHQPTEQGRIVTEVERQLSAVEELR